MTADTPATHTATVDALLLRTKWSNSHNLQLVLANFPQADAAAAAAAAAAANAATANDLQLVIANDPDADRLAAAEQTMLDGKGTGQFTTFSGNDIGLLLADWVWTNFRKQHPEVGSVSVFVIFCASDYIPAAAVARMFWLTHCFNNVE
jgi:hypothetical protein